MAVLDASVLIALAKIGRLQLLQRVYGNALIGRVVYEEVVEAGKRTGALGVEQVEQAIESGWLHVVTLTPAERRLAGRLARTTRLHDGEVEALAIARRRGQLVIVDDKSARRTAKTLGLDYVGTAGVLLEAFLGSGLTLGELENALVDLSRAIWLAPDVVAMVLKVAREQR